jgi:hypothetical protein
MTPDANNCNAGLPSRPVSTTPSLTAAGRTVARALLFIQLKPRPCSTITPETQQKRQTSNRCFYLFVFPQATFRHHSLAVEYHHQRETLLENVVLDSILEAMLFLSCLITVLMLLNQHEIYIYKSECVSVCSRLTL